MAISDSSSQSPYLEQALRSWIDYDWYSNVVAYKLQGTLTDAKERYGAVATARVRATQRRSLLFVIVDLGDGNTCLARWERNSSLSRCILPSQVRNALVDLHNEHGHFSDDLMARKAMGKYWWPSRRKDIYEYFRTCFECQMIGPLRPTASILPVMAYMPLDMYGQDYLGPISPRSNSGMRYIYVGVDYLTRKLFAKAVRYADSATTVETLKAEVVKPFGLPLVIYNDNGSHFLGECSEYLFASKVKQIFAPPWHPSSVGLAERYVQLIKVGLQKALQTDYTDIHDWDRVLPVLVRDINQRATRVAGFVPDELFFGYIPRHDMVPLDVEPQVRAEAIA